MKIIQINSVCGVGSTGRIATDLHKTLNENGHDTYVMYGRGQAPKEINSIKISSDLDNRIHGIYTRVTDKHGFGSVKSTENAVKYIRDLNPDIIHLHNIHGYYINIEMLFNELSSLNKPVLWTLHDCWAFTGHCAYFDYIECERWKTNCYSCPQKKAYPSSKIMGQSKILWDLL